MLDSAVHGAKPPPRVVAHWTARARHGFANIPVRLLLANLLVSLLPSVSFSRVRTAIYRFAGLQIGDNTMIFGRIEFTGPGAIQDRLHIGSHVVINEHLFVDLNGIVTIGDWVSIGHHVTLITSEHDVGPAHCRAGKLRPKDVTIENGAWIAACSTILPGVTIGHSSVVAAGSLVSGSIPPNRVVGGVPARALRSLPESP